MITVVHADTGDWVAIYRDGKLVDQGHSFQEEQLLRLLGIEHKAIYNADVGATGWKFPPILEEVAA